MDLSQIAEVLEFAVDIARQAGRLTLDHFDARIEVITKADATPVTVADHGAEELLRGRIEKAYPGHGIVGEEFGETAGRLPGRWILDPIDGTFSFISGVGLYSTLVGFEWEGQMLAGVIHLPVLDRTVCAGRGLGCRCNGSPARVSSTAELGQARVSTTSLTGHDQHGTIDAYLNLRRACRTDRGWPDAYAYALLATGNVDIVVDPAMSLWDIAPLQPIVTEAGGSLTDWDGQPTHTADRALATNGRLLDLAVRCLRQGGLPTSTPRASQS